MPPPNAQLLQDVIARGRAALDEWRAARDMGGGAAGMALGNRQQVYGAFSGQGSGPAPNRGQLFNQLYENFQGGLNPQPSQVVYGQVRDAKGKPGAYAGFKNASDLWNAIEGRGVAYRDQALQGADALRSGAESGLNALSSDFDTAYQAALRSMAQERASLYPEQVQPMDATPQQPEGSVGTASATLNGNTFPVSYKVAPEAAPAPVNYASSRQATLHAPLTQAQVGQAQNTADAHQQYFDQLNQWLAGQADPYTQQIEAANQIAQTPLSQYEAAAGAAYGVDPYITAGRFGAQEDVSDFTRQRNLDAMQSYGLPYDEVLSLQKQATGALADQQSAASDADQQALIEAIGAQTGTDPNALAQSADLSIPQLAQIISDPDYQTANQTLQEILANPDDPESGTEFERTMREIGAQRPDLYRLLQAQYGSFEPSDYSFFAPAGG